MRPEKSRLRRMMKAQRAALPRAEAQRRSEAACRRLLEWHGLFVPGTAVCAYAALPGELDPALAVAGLLRRGVRTLVPRMPARAAHGAPLELVEIDDRTPLSPRGALGIPEPAAELPAVPYAGVAAFLLPVLAFDLAGRRLGYGRGHFDATLEQAPRALRIALAFDLQRVDECPVENHDERLDAVVTDRAVHVTGARPAIRLPWPPASTGTPNSSEGVQ